MIKNYTRYCYVSDVKSKLWFIHDMKLYYKCDDDKIMCFGGLDDIIQPQESILKPSTIVELVNVSFRVNNKKSDKNGKMVSYGINCWIPFIVTENGLFNNELGFVKDGEYEECHIDIEVYTS